MVNILCLEDSELIIKYIERILEPTPYVVDFFSSIKDASDNILKYNYKIAIIDLNIDDSSGVSTLYKFRKINKGNIPIIVLTSIDDIEVLKSCLVNGAEDVIVKPIRDVKNFLLKIELLIKLNGDNIMLKRKHQQISSMVWKDILEYQKHH